MILPLFLLRWVLGWSRLNLPFFSVYASLSRAVTPQLSILYTPISGAGMKTFSWIMSALSLLASEFFEVGRDSFTLTLSVISSSLHMSTYSSSSSLAFYPAIFVGFVLKLILLSHTVEKPPHLVVVSLLIRFSFHWIILGRMYTRKLKKPCAGAKTQCKTRRA